MTVEELKVIITAETASLRREVNGVQKQIKGMQTTTEKVSKGMSKAFSAIKWSAIIYGLARVIKSTTELAGDLTEVQNVVEVAFGDMSNIIDNWAADSIKQFGMTQVEAKRTASTFMAMANGMGVASKQGAIMAKNLAGLSADIASFWNTSQEEAFVALKSVYTGETETLKKYGIVLTETNLKQYALSKGIKKQYSELSQAEKVALRYSYVLNVTKDAQGDFMRTNTSWTNQIKILKSQLQELKTIIGKGFVAVLRPVVVELNKILSRVIDIANAITITVTKTFGGKEKTLEINTDKSTESINDTTDAVKDLKKEYELANFDELNVLGKQDTTDNTPQNDSLVSSLVDGELINSDGVIGKYDDLLQRIKDRWNEWKDKNGLSFKFDWPTIKESLINLGKQIKDAVVDFLPQLWNSIIEALNKWDFTNLVLGLINGLKTITAHVQLLLQSIADIFHTLIVDIPWDTIGMSAAQGVAAAVNIILDLVTTTITLINKILQDINIGPFLNSFVGMVAAVIIAIHSLVGTLCDAILNFYDTGLSPIFKWIGNALEGAFAVIRKIATQWAVFFAQMREPIAEIGTVLGQVVSLVWQLLEPFANAIWSVFLNIITAISNCLMTVGQTVLENLVPALSDLLTALQPIFDVLTELIEWIVDIFLGETVDGIYDFFSALGEQLSLIITLVSDVLNFVTGAINAIVGLLTGDLNMAIDGVKQMIGSLGQFISDALGNWWNQFTNWIDNIISKVKEAIDWIKKMLSANKEAEEERRQKHIESTRNIYKDKAKNNGWRTWSVPKMAKGGAVTSPTLAMIGEYQGASSNPEIVAPQSLIQETMEKSNNQVVNAIYSIGNQISKTVEDKDSNVYMDTVKVSREITKEQKNQSRYGSSSMVVFG